MSKKQKAAVRPDCDRLCPPVTSKAEKRPLADEAADKELGALAKAISHPVRIRILRILSARDSCVCSEINDEFSLAPSTVSEHLRILKDAGLIRGTIKGPNVCYCIDRQALRRIQALAKAL